MKKTYVLVVVALVLAVAGGFSAGHLTAPPPAPPATQHHDEPHEHKTVPDDVAPTEAWSTLTAFLSGWLNTEPARRAAVFEATATEALQERLAEVVMTSPVPVERIAVEGSTDWLTEFHVFFVGVDAPLKFRLVAQPDGWLVNEFTRW